jgi:hypothetical protein
LLSSNFMCKEEVYLTSNTIIKMLALYLQLVYFLQFLYRYKQVSCGRAFSAEYALHLDEVICYDEKSMCCILYELLNRFCAVSFVMKV